MSKKPAETIDERKERLAAAFTAIRSKTDLSMDAFARLLGYKRASSIQRYGSAALHTGQFLKGEVLERMLAALPGKYGITEEEVRELGGPLMSGHVQIREQPVGGLGPAMRQARRQRSHTIREVADAANVQVDELDEWEAGELRPSGEQIARIAEFLHVDPSALERGEVLATDDEPMADAVFTSDAMPAYSGPRDVEKLGVVAAGDDGDFEFNGTVAELVMRPRGLVGRPGVFSLEVISDSMYPAYRKGDPIFCDRTQPQIGDDVVIETFPDEGATVGKSFVKRLKRRSKSTLVVEQFNPPLDLTFNPYEIKHLWRVVPARELHGY